MFTARYEFNICIKFMAVGSRPFTVEPGFDPRSVHMRFLVGKETLGHLLFPRVLRFFLVSIISANSPYTPRIHVAFPGRTIRRSLGTFQKAMLFGKSWSIG